MSNDLFSGYIKKPKDAPYTNFACAIYITLFLVQLVFVLTWAVGAVSWHWSLIFIPTWIFLGILLFASGWMVWNEVRKDSP